MASPRSNAGDERWLNISGYASTPMKPEEFERIVVQDWEILKKIIAEAKIKAE